jgi:pimeloyl-ACP methyl ester carboxylesterase
VTQLPAVGGRLVSVGGLRLHVIECGDPAAPPLVLLHGLSCSSTWWEPGVPTLARERRVIRIDLLGHGRSDKPRRGYTVERHAALVAGVLDSLGIAGAVVAGHSMGALVATALAEQRPGLVEGIADLDEPARFEHLNFSLLARLYVKPLIGPLMHSMATTRSRRYGLRPLFAAGFEVPNDLAVEQGQVSYAALTGSYRSLARWMREEAVDERLARLGIPLLVIWGEGSRLVSPAAREVDYASLADTRIVQISGVGHSPQLEAPATTARLLLEFGATVDAHPPGNGLRSNQ